MRLYVSSARRVKDACLLTVSSESDGVPLVLGQIVEFLQVTAEQLTGFDA